MKAVIINRPFKICLAGAVHPTAIEASEDAVEHEDEVADFAVANGLGAWPSIKKQARAAKGDK